MAAHGPARQKEVGPQEVKVLRRTRPRAMRPTDPAHESPAAVLQAQLPHIWTEEQVDEARWSARRSWAFLLLFSSVFWAALAVAINGFLAASH